MATLINCIRGKGHTTIPYYYWPRQYYYTVLEAGPYYHTVLEVGAILYDILEARVLLSYRTIGQGPTILLN